MAVIYEKCQKDHAVFDIIGKLMMQPQFRELKEAKVTISVLMAASDDTKPAVKLHGYPCLATIRNVPYKQRVQGMTDAEITIDQHEWDSVSDQRQLALIDHELSHLEIKRTDTGEVATDDLGRPKLRMRLHDWELGGFQAVADRHGDDAAEVIAAVAFKDKFGEFLFEFADSAA